MNVIYIFQYYYVLHCAAEIDKDTIYDAYIIAAILNSFQIHKMFYCKLTFFVCNNLVMDFQLSKNRNLLFMEM